jgi:membrane protein
VYFSWLVVLLGAIIAAALSHWRVGTWQQARLPGWRFEAALRVLQALAGAQASGHSVTLAWLRKRVDLGLEEIEEILDRLAHAHIARRSDKDGWLLSRAPQDIGAAEVFRLFVFDAGAPAAEAQGAYQAMLAKLDAQQRTALAASVADLKSEAPEAPEAPETKV